MLVPTLVGAGIGAGLNLVGQVGSNPYAGKGAFEDFNWGSFILAGLTGAAFATGIGGFWGATGIGAASNAGTSAFENESWGNILASAIVGGISAGVGFVAGRYIANNLPMDMNLGFNGYFDLGRMDAGVIRSAYHAFRGSWYTFLPTIARSSSRALIKIAGNFGIGWF